MGEPSEAPAVVRYMVTQEDLDHGKQLACFECPHARAIARRFGQLGRDGRAVNVGYRAVALLEASGAVVRFYRLSARARDHIFAFDAGKPVSPGTFVLRPPVGEA